MYEFFSDGYIQATLIIDIIAVSLILFLIFKILKKENNLKYTVGIFFLAWIISFNILVYENVYRFDEWKTNELKAKIDDKNKDTSYNKRTCINRFLDSEGKNYEFYDSLTTSFRILEWSAANNSCFNTPSKHALNLSYILVILGFSFAIFGLLHERIRHGRNLNKHIIVIGLNQYSVELIKNLIREKEKVKVYEKDSSNIYIEEIKRIGALVYIGSFDSYISEEYTDIFNSKEIFILNEDDSETLNNLSTLLEHKKEVLKSDKKELSEELMSLIVCEEKIIKKVKIHVEIKNRDNKVFFEKSGTFNLIDENYEINLFNLDELIAHRLIEHRPLSINVNYFDENMYSQNILLMGFNNLSDEILYHILKQGHFANEKPIKITVVDKEYKMLILKYKDWIERGNNPYFNVNKNILWHLEFVSNEFLYEKKFYIENDLFKFNRIILCYKESNKSVDVLSYLNKVFYSKIKDKNTLVQLYNSHLILNKSIDANQNNFKNYYTFGDIETISNPELIRKNNLLIVSEATNDYKEDKSEDKWKNLDSFTRESNITEKQHMILKIDYLDLKFNMDNKNNTNNFFKTFHNNNKNLIEGFSDDDLKRFLSLPKLKDNLKGDLEKKVKNDTIIEKSDITKFINDTINMNSIFVLSALKLYIECKEIDNLDEKLTILARVEHTRWNAFHILNGWTRMNLEKKNKRKEEQERGHKIKDSKDSISKEHYDLCDWETLEKENPGVIKYDYKNIYQIPFVAYCLGWKIEKRYTYVIGDVHGCYFTLKKLISKLPENSEIILLGDLCDRGLHTKDVIEFVMKKNYKVILGNHDEYMIKYSIEAMKDIKNKWIREDYMGGKTTIESYGNDNETLIKHIDWLKTLPNYMIIDNYFLTHGFGLPYYKRRDEKEKSHYLYKNKIEKEEKYYYDWEDGWRDYNITNIFGHSDYQEVEKGKNYYGIDTGCGYGRKLTAIELGSMKIIEEECDKRDINKKEIV